MSLRLRIAVVAVVVAVIVAAAVAFSRGHGFRADQNSPAYLNGYAYGHDLMTQTNDVATACEQATVDDPASSDGKNFAAGCQAGYEARTPAH